MSTKYGPYGSIVAGIEVVELLVVDVLVVDVVDVEVVYCDAYAYAVPEVSNVPWLSSSAHEGVLHIL